MSVRILFYFLYCSFVIDNGISSIQSLKSLILQPQTKRRVGTKQESVRKERHLKTFQALLCLHKRRTKSERRRRRKLRRMKRKRKVKKTKAKKEELENEGGNERRLNTDQRFFKAERFFLFLVLLEVTHSLPFQSQRKNLQFLLQFCPESLLLSNDISVQNRTTDMKPVPNSKCTFDCTASFN